MENSASNGKIYFQKSRRTQDIISVGHRPKGEGLKYLMCSKDVSFTQSLERTKENTRVLEK